MKKNQRIHLIAIGGAAMHNLAIELQFLGHRVSGSDDQIYDPSKSRLKKAGLHPHSMGWFPESIDEAIDAVIVGMHAKKDNPELLRAQELGIPVFSYPEFLFSTMKDQNKRIVIAGSHGKTTTTSMVLHCINECRGLENINYMVGALIPGLDKVFQLSSKAECSILEGDEYLSSPIDLRSKFLWYRPQIAVLTGIAWDHINVFPTEESYRKTFQEFLQSLPSGGMVFYADNDSSLAALVNDHAGHLYSLPYLPLEGKSEGATTRYTENNVVYTFPFFGRYNMANASAAIAICRQLGMERKSILDALQSFQGANLRMMSLYSSSRLSIYRDFAHAPSKVNAAVKAIQEQFPMHMIHGVLELNTYSSLSSSFLPHYRGALDGLESATVFYSAKALEIKKKTPLDPQNIRNGFAREDISLVSSPEALEEVLSKLDLSAGPSIVLFMGSAQFGGINILNALNATEE